MHKEDKCTVEPYIPCYKKLCAQIPLKALTRPIPKTPYIIFSPPTGKCVEDKEKGIADGSLLQLEKGILPHSRISAACYLGGVHRRHTNLGGCRQSLHTR